MKPVLSTEEVVRLEDIIEREGTSKAELMELAGEFAANEILKLNPDRVLVLVGFALLAATCTCVSAPLVMSWRC